MKTSFSFINKTKQKVLSKGFLFILEKFLKKMKIDVPVEVNLILVGKKKIQSLNNIYRKKNKPTDVLSFPIDVTDPKQLEEKKQALTLGDIYICPQMVEEGGLKDTFLHGLVHLIGYDHMDDRQQKEWDRIIKKIMS